MPADDNKGYRFTFGPWNISVGADMFGPAVRKEVPFSKLVKLYKQLGFDGVQFHDDDVVPADWKAAETERGVKKVKKILDGEGLFCELVAPRLWEHPQTIDGAFTSNSAADRKYAIQRAKRAIDMAHLLETNRLVLWLAREGTYIREAKDPVASVGGVVEAINQLLEYDPQIRILLEAKPNEPMDASYLPTPAHMIGIAYRTVSPERVGVLIESAHAILAGLDPSDEMAYALWHGKLWSVHLNDQNGLKFDEDKAFGSVDLRRAFNQVWVLERFGYGKNGECVGFDVKAMRTTKDKDATQHLANSRRFFLNLVDVARSLDTRRIEELRAQRNYEELERYVVEALMGRR
jgi:xylose isomerase